MFTKLFSSITDSTIWREPDHVRLVWITMLAKCDKHGIVYASVPGLADAARVSLESCQDAILKLSSPDEWSRSKDDGGRRIHEVDGGWILINHAKYKRIKDADERREYVREKVKLYRARKQNVNNVNNVNTGKPGKHIRSDQIRSDKEEEPSAPSLNIEIPKSLSDERFLVVWSDWVAFRKTLKKSKDWTAFFNKQLAELEKWGLEAAMASIKHSLLNEYQGLFFPKNLKPIDRTISKPHSVEDYIKAQEVK